MPSNNCNDASKQNIFFIADAIVKKHFCSVQFGLGWYYTVLPCLILYNSVIINIIWQCYTKDLGYTYLKPLKS